MIFRHYAVIVVCIILCMGLYFWSKPVEPTLYDRLGGIYRISDIVNHFSDALVVNPIVGKNSANIFLRDWNVNMSESRLPGLKFMRTLWLAAVAGGPYKYTPTQGGKCPFSTAHSKFQISPEEFDATAAELSRSLDYFGVAEREKNEVLAVFSAHKNEVNAGYNNAHGVATVINC